LKYRLISNRDGHLITRALASATRWPMASKLSSKEKLKFKISRSRSSIRGSSLWGSTSSAN